MSPPQDESALLAALRAGDEVAFSALIDSLSPALIRFAEPYVGRAAAAEDVVQDTWLAVIAGLERFDGRSTLRTWIFAICRNQAYKRAKQEKRSLPFSSLQLGDHSPSVDPECFLPADHPSWPGHWSSVPQRWDHLPEERVLAEEIRRLLGAAVEALPWRQRLLLMLRDIQGMSAEEAGAVIDVTTANQRVLLHRARSSVRRALEDHLAAAAEPTGRPNRGKPT